MHQTNSNSRHSSCKRSGALTQFARKHHQIFIMTFAEALTVYIFLISAAKDLVCASSLTPAYDPRLRRLIVAEVVPTNATNKTLSTLYVTPIPAAQSNSVLNNRPLYYLPPQHRINAATPEIAKFRNEGNFYQGKSQQAAAPTAASTLQQKEEYAASVGYPRLALYEHMVLHEEPPPTPVHYEVQEYRPRRYTRKLNNTNNSRDASPAIKESIVRNDDQRQDDQVDVVEDQQHLTKKPAKETHYFHDIFMRYVGPQRRDFGHVEQSPELIEQRFESLDKGNRYKGEVKWADASGGYGEHRWNMAQGKLLR